MIKVFLVEDEFVVRQGIKKNIDWEENGFIFCGEAQDGELALPLIKEEQPDIVITDIKMPFMNGLELSRILKKEMPEIEIVLLSGYEEFEYAKEAINLGVAQYLTKPINGEELISKLKIIADKIEEKRHEKELKDKLKKQMEQKSSGDKGDLFKELASGSKSVGDLLELANKLRTVTESFENASRAIANQGSGEANSAETTGTINVKKSYQEEFNITTSESKQINRSRLRDFLRMGDYSDTENFVDEFFVEIGTNAKNSIIFRQYIVMDVYFGVVEFLEELQLDKEELAGIPVTDNTIKTQECAMEYICRIISRAIELRDLNAADRYQSIVNEVIQYIEHNYADDELSLNELANLVNFSPNHLSTIFSKQTGKTFIKYLTDYRMQKAKELLRCTGKRSSEISLEVGYKDPHYFSSLFKKTQGVTPTQYREAK